MTSLSSVVSLPTSLHMSLVSSRHQQHRTSLCDDSFFLKQVRTALVFPARNVTTKEECRQCSEVTLCQVASHVRQKVLRRLDRVCGLSLYCDVAQLEAICEDILGEQHIITNEVTRRRRGARAQAEAEEADMDLSSLVNTSVSVVGPGGAAGDKRQTIEIVFKIVGKVQR